MSALCSQPANHPLNPSLSLFLAPPFLWRSLRFFRRPLRISQCPTLRQRSSPSLDLGLFRYGTVIFFLHRSQRNHRSTALTLKISNWWFPLCFRHLYSSLLVKRQALGTWLSLDLVRFVTSISAFPPLIVDDDCLLST